MPRIIRSIRNMMCGLGLSGLLLSACATAASTGDDVIRTASLGRIQATPFTDHMLTRDCRAALDATYGFVREARSMKNGVFVVQAFDCKADLIIAEVSLNNYTAAPMHCFAQTENGVYGVTIAPKASGFFEYAFGEQAFQDCQPVVLAPE